MHQMLPKAPLHEEHGSELVEFSLVLIVMLSVVYLIMDVSWLIFEQASLQWAAQQGVRFAVTSKTAPGGQDAAIKAAVQKSSMGFLNGTGDLNKISISYYNPANLSKVVTGSGSNAGGNVVKVSISGVGFSALAPIYTDNFTTVWLSANSSDVMESSPGGVPPTR